MPIVDADTHVIECLRTWDYLEGSDRQFRPQPVGDGWIVDGRFVLREDGDPGLSMAIKTMEDLPGRLAWMDRMGVDVQVLYPGLFLTFVTDRPDVELALCRSYNRWLADVCSGSSRFRWAVVPPLLSMPEALAELEFGKQHGACAVVLRGIECDRTLTDPYFSPLYEKASELDIAVVVHAGNGSRAICEMLGVTDRFYAFVQPVVAAFDLLLRHAVPDRFPKLRWGFLEAGAAWVPDVLRRVARSHRAIGTAGVVEDEWTALRAQRLYVALRTDNDLPYVARWAAGNLVLGTDFSHSDPNAEIDALENLRLRSGLEAEVVDGILSETPCELYGI